MHMETLDNDQPNQTPVDTIPQAVISSPAPLPIPERKPGNKKRQPSGRGRGRPQTIEFTYTEVTHEDYLIPNRVYPCSRCKQSFLKNELEQTKTWPLCLECRRAKGRERARSTHIKRMYGMTLEEFNIQLNLRGSRCDICQEVNSQLVPDHCHTKGTFRGFLCSKCNYGLGNFRDNPAFLSRAIKYLKAPLQSPQEPISKPAKRLSEVNRR